MSNSESTLGLSVRPAGGLRPANGGTRHDRHGNIFTFSFCEPFLERLADFIEADYIKKNRELSRLAIVFGGRRPSLFLKRELAGRVGKTFLSPKFFTIDEFIAYTVRKKEAFVSAKDLDHCYLIFKLAQEITPGILKGRETFARFLPWAREILSFIDQLDLENVKNEFLRPIESNAQAGYAVPKDINQLLESIVTLKKAYHEKVFDEKKYSRGLQYLRAAQLINQIKFEEFDQILFCNFFYFSRCEEAAITHLYKEGKAVLFFQGDERKWPILKRAGNSFRTSLREAEEIPAPPFKLKIFSGFDLHSQIGLVREILKEIKNPKETVIVLPQSDHIIPLISEVAGLLKEFNVSMGYPLRRSSLYSLLEFVFKAQLSKKENRYYAKDYLKLMRHPFVKNLRLKPDPTVPRILIHKLEEILTGQVKTDMSGRLFLDLQEVEESEDLYLLAKEMLNRLNIPLSKGELKNILQELHNILFRSWESVKNFNDFSAVLESFLDIFVEKSFLKNYPLNLNIATRMYEINEELKTAQFIHEDFPQEEIFKIFDQKITGEMVAFHGTPLRGLQILGLFETRSLNFENVIIMDTNEGVLPKLNVYEPLIPREVMVSLNLDRMELEEEIQRYQFMRLISSAKNVYLVYQEGKEKERSRFIEELIWEEEKKTGDLNAAKITRAAFEVNVACERKLIHKTPRMIEFLKNFTYSASSINMYLRDPLEFYYSHVLGLKEKEDLLDEPEARQVGTFVHELLEESFKPFLKKEPRIDAAFRRRFSKIFEQKFENTFGKGLASDSFLLQSVLEERLRRFLDNEELSEQRQVQEILYLEHRFEDSIPLSVGNVKFKYIVDRVDELKDGTVMIIDYKTGGIDQMPKGIDSLRSLDLSREAIRDSIRSFQIPLYFYCLDRQFPQKPINAALYNLRTLELNKFLNEKTLFSRKEINQTFLQALDFILREIFDPELGFVSGQE